MYSIYIYNMLLVNVSVSLIVSEVLPHMTPGRQRKPYTFEDWTLTSKGILVKCLSHTALTLF